MNERCVVLDQHTFPSYPSTQKSTVVKSLQRVSSGNLGIGGHFGEVIAEESAATTAIEPWRCAAFGVPEIENCATIQV